jgi:hypothetical protein
MIRVFMPLESPFVSAIYKPVDTYLSFFSLYQDWLMFAPNPSRLNGYVSAEVEFDDGTKDTYSFPKPDELNFVQKYVYGEKLRKFISEGVRKDENSWMWPDTAKFVLRQMKSKHFSRLPVKVHLYRHWNETADIREEVRPHLQGIPKYDSYRFYTYEVI